MSQAIHGQRKSRLMTASTMTTIGTATTAPSLLLVPLGLPVRSLTR